MIAKRADLLEALEELGKRHPEMRFGQLVANAAYWAKGPERSAVWEVEDEELIEAIRRHLSAEDLPETVASIR